MWCVNIVHNPAWWVGAYPCIRSMLGPAPLCQLCHWHENRGRLLHSALLCALMMHKPLLDQHQAAYAEAPTGMLHTYQHCNNGSHTVHTEEWVHGLPNDLLTAGCTIPHWKLMGEGLMRVEMHAALLASRLLLFSSARPPCNTPLPCYHPCKTPGVLDPLLLPC